MPKFDTIKAGETLYDCHRVSMGNTTMRHWALYKVRVISVDPATRTAICSWNNNRPEKYSERRLAGLTRTVPKKYTDQEARRRR